MRRVVIALLCAAALMHTEYEDLYEILGIDESASAVEIKKAYRRLSLKHRTICAQ